MINQPLLLKLGVFKNFVKALKNNAGEMKYLEKKFPKISNAQIKEDNFVGTQMRELLNDDKFSGTLNAKELEAWDNFKLLCENFFGNYKSPNYKDLVANLLKSYKNINVNMSLKIHFLQSHLGFLAENLCDVSDEYGEIFHQNIMFFKKRFQGGRNGGKVALNKNILADYLWFGIRDINPQFFKRKRRRQCCISD